jgi:hypothetical protein
LKHRALAATILTKQGHPTVGLAIVTSEGEILILEAADVLNT